MKPKRRSSAPPCLGQIPAENFTNMGVMAYLINKKPQACPLPTEPDDVQYIDPCKVCGHGHSQYGLADNANMLLAWENLLAERVRIGQKIMSATKKTSNELLFNRTTTVDYRDKVMIKRMVHHAQRMTPRSQLLPLLEDCVRLTEPISTYLRKPNAKRRRMCAFEVSGIPKVIRHELLGDSPPVTTASNYLRSSATTESLLKNKRVIKGVLEFFPDIDNLEVVGVQIKKPPDFPNCPPTDGHGFRPMNPAQTERPTKSIYDLIKESAALRKKKGKRQTTDVVLQRCPCCTPKVTEKTSDSDLDNKPNKIY